MKAWNIVTGLFGIIGAIVGIAWWLGVTPGMVGEQVYAISYAILPFAMLVFGVFVGVSAKGLFDKKKFVAENNQITELSKRPTQEQMNEALAEKDALIAELESPPVFEGEQALNFVRCLTDNQHIILREMYDNGGTLLADPLDGDMQQLAKYGMVERPSMFTPGVVTKWTLPPNVNMIIREHPDVLESEAERRAREVEAQLDQFSVAQLDLMARIADAESDDGFLATPYQSQDHKIASQLQEQHVTNCDTKKDKCMWYLDPQWRMFVATRRAEIDERAKPLKDRREKDTEERRRKEEEREKSRENLPPSAPIVRQ